MSKIPAEGNLDRERAHVQERLSALEPYVRRRVQGKCRIVGRIGAFDLDDVMSSARRRLDLALLERRIIVGSDAELGALLERTAQRVLIDIIRRETQRRSVELAPQMMRRPSSSTANDEDEDHEAIDTLLSQLDEEDRRILELVARGTSHERIAEEIGVSLCAYRSRWRRLKTRVASWCKIRWRAG